MERNQRVRGGAEMLLIHSSALISNVMTKRVWTRNEEQIFRRLFSKSWDERYDLFDLGSTLKTEKNRTRTF